jgi:hypothetical protein
MQTAGPWVRTALSRDEVFSSQPPDILREELSFEWNAVCRERCNVLVEASPAVAGQILAALRPQMRTPIHEHIPKAGAPVPQPREGSLLLLEAGRLGRGEQAELLRWLNERDGKVQVVATSSQPLFPLVERGSFDAGLYYRLNIVRIAI